MKIFSALRIKFPNRARKDMIVKWEKIVFAFTTSWDFILQTSIVDYPEFQVDWFMLIVYKNQLGTKSSPFYINLVLLEKSYNVRN